MNGISVVICCYNAKTRIVPTLQHLQKQEFQKTVNWEVVVVDNASTDNTSEAAQQVWNENPVTKLSVVIENIPGLMNARRRGITEASYEIVSFIDDDNWVNHDWVQKVSEIFTLYKDAGACGGKVEAVFEKNEPAWFHQFRGSFAVGEQADQSGFIDDTKGFLWGAGLSIKKSAWNELMQKGFQPMTTGRDGQKMSAGEDTEICYALRLLGYRLYYSNELLLQHFMPENRMSVSYLEKMTHGFGVAYARLNSYRVLLNAGNFQLHPWWYEWLVAVKNVFLFSVRIFFSGNTPAVIKMRVTRAYNQGYSQQVWKDKDRIKKNAEKLKQLFIK